MTTRVDLSALTVTELDEVAGMLAAGTPDPEVARHVEHLTTRHLQAAALAGTLAAITWPLSPDQDFAAMHFGTAGETYGR
jgi:hypothetical protein